MSRLFLLVCFLYGASAVSQTWHSDPFRKRWQSEKAQAVRALNQIQLKHLLATAPEPVKKWLEAQDAAGENGFRLLGEELDKSPLTFTTVSPDNPEGHNPEVVAATPTLRQEALFRSPKWTAGN